MNFKIKITSPEHSKAVQEAVFKLGGCWGYEEPKNTPQYVYQHFLYLIDNVFTYGHNDITFFNNHPATEVFLQQDGAFSEAELNVQPDEVHSFAKMRIKVLNTYHSECVQAALFKLGYKWYDCPFGVAYHKDKKWLWTNNSGSITYSHCAEVNDEDNEFALVDLQWLDKMVAEKNMKDKDRELQKKYLMVSKTPDVVQGSSLKDSGVRVEVGTGAVRERAEGKGRFDLLPAYGLYSVARQMEAGAAKYSERNWEKGLPLSWFADAASRHLSKFIAGYNDEPHLAAAQWNLMCLAEGQERIRVGLWPKELDDLPKTYAGIAPSF